MMHLERTGQRVVICMAICGVIALAAYFFRWEIAPGQRPGTVYRLDRWTGTVVWCRLDSDSDQNTLNCDAK